MTDKNVKKLRMIRAIDMVIGRTAAERFVTTDEEVVAWYAQQLEALYDIRELIKNVGG